jgi:hypothetical protein
MASLYSTNAAASSDPHGSIRSEDGLLGLKLARPCVPCRRTMPPIPNSSSPTAMQPAVRTHSFMSHGMPATAFSDDDIDAVAALIEMGQEASCWSPRLQ